MLKYVALGFMCVTGFAFGGEKGQAAKAPEKATIKSANKIIVEQTTTEYAPVAKKRKLLYRPVSVKKVMGEVETCPNCKK